MALLEQWIIEPTPSIPPSHTLQPSTPNPGQSLQSAPPGPELATLVSPIPPALQLGMVSKLPSS